MMGIGLLAYRYPTGFLIREFRREQATRELIEAKDVEATQTAWIRGNCMPLSFMFIMVVRSMMHSQLTRFTPSKI